MNGHVYHGSRGGLTLIELVAALVLLSILLAALTGLLPRFAARAADRDAALKLHDSHWSRVALERLADDLVNAETGWIEDGTLHLSGRVDRDLSTGLLTDRDGICRYCIVSLPTRTLLVREQNSVRTLLGAGRVTLTIQSRQRDGTESASVGFGAPSADEHEGKAEPEPLNLAPQMRIAILGRTGETLASLHVVRETIVDGPSGVGIDL